MQKQKRTFQLKFIQEEAPQKLLNMISIDQTLRGQRSAWHSVLKSENVPFGEVAQGHVHIFVIIIALLYNF